MSEDIGKTLKSYGNSPLLDSLLPRFETFFLRPSVLSSYGWSREGPCGNSPLQLRGRVTETQIALSTPNKLVSPTGSIGSHLKSTELSLREGWPGTKASSGSILSKS